MTSSTDHQDTKEAASGHGYNDPYNSGCASGASRDLYRLLAVIAILLIHAALVLSSSRQKSAVMDEPFHIAPGVAALSSGDFRLSVDSPPLANVLCALPLMLLPDLQVPLSHPAFLNPKADVSYRKKEFANYLLWKHDLPYWKGNPDPALMVRLARLPILVLSVLLGLLLFHWAGRLYGPREALAALALYAFSPTVMAHAGLATADLASAFFIFLASYAIYRHLDRPGPATLVLAGFALGLALLAKHTGVFLLALWPVVLLVYKKDETWSKRVGRMFALRAETGYEFTGLPAYLVMVGIAWVTVWAGYGFEVNSIHDPATLLSVPVSGDKLVGFRRLIIGALAAIPLPPRTYFYGLCAGFLNQAAEHDPVYFLGQVRDTGWWYYYPVLFVMKAPTSLLALMAAAAVLHRRLSKLDSMVGRLVLITAAGLLVIFMVFNTRTIGLRHVLPVFPFLFLALARLVNPILIPARLRRGLVIVLALYLINGLISWPDYLVHFNYLAGGPDRGLKYSVVGEDWGQDLPGLAAYCRGQGIEEIRYYPYTYADPRAYGVPYVRFDCEDRSPGWYAFHVVDLERPRKNLDEKCLSDFRKMSPVAIVGHTIYIYRVR